MIDPDGIHRAVLNIVTNAIDACEGAEGRSRRVINDVGRRTTLGADRGQRQRRRHR